MITKWRVVKKATGSGYAYTCLEFCLETGTYKGYRIDSNNTMVRKRSTSQFEVLDNNTWETMSPKDVWGFIHEFNRARPDNAVTETEILHQLYKLENIK